MAFKKKSRLSSSNKSEKYARKFVFGVSTKTFIKFKKTSGINTNLTIEQFKALILLKQKFTKFLHQQQIILDRFLLVELKEDLEFIRLIANYTYTRHKFCLPARGQRSRTNAKTQRKKKHLKG